MDQAGPSSNASSSGASSTTASSYLSLSPEDYVQFKAQATHQIMVLQRMYQELKNSFSMERTKNQEITQDIALLKDKTRPITEKITTLQKFVAKITDENSKLKKGVGDQDEATKKFIDDKNLEIQTLRTMIESLTRANDENRARRPVGGAAGGANFEIPQNFHEVMNVLEQQMGAYDMKLAEADLRFQILETTSYDGTILWKIQDFGRRRDDAKRGAALSIYSQPFYTSRYGYKMCLRVYLNGDGMGRNTHISLFFVLMKGEYDPLLSFPFKQKVTLYLMDQGPQQRHLTDNFRPDPSSSSFRKPTSDMNIASGCPMFVAHNTLGNSDYVVNDTIFIRAIIDTSDLENF